MGTYVLVYERREHCRKYIAHVIISLEKLFGYFRSTEIGRMSIGCNVADRLNKHSFCCFFLLIKTIHKNIYRGMLIKYTFMLNTDISLV